MNEIKFTAWVYLVTIWPDDPITVCEIYRPDRDQLISYGLGVRKHGDVYDRETGSRMALRAAIIRSDMSDLYRVDIWAAYLAIFPISERKAVGRVCTSTKVPPGKYVDHGHERVKALYTDPGLVNHIDVHELLEKLLRGNNPLVHCYREKFRGWRGMWDEEMTWKP